MSSFGTGSLDLSGTNVVLSNFTGTNGAAAGSDGLVPGPAVAQADYVLGAGGDWTLEIKGGIGLGDSTNRIATTQFVQQVVAAAVLGGAANLSALGDIDFTAGLLDDQFIRYDAGSGKWLNVTVGLGDLNGVDLTGLAVGNTLIWDGANFVPGAGGGGGAANLNDLGDVTIAAAANKHFLVNNGAGQFVNRVISTADLNDESNIVLVTRAATFGAFIYDFTGVTAINVPTPVGPNEASTKGYVDVQIATVQPLDATLTALAAVITAADKIIYATGNDTFTTSDLTVFGRTLIDDANAADARATLGLGTAAVEPVGTFAQVANNLSDLTNTGDARNNLGLGTAAQSAVADFLSSNTSIDALNDVDISTNVPQNGQTLVWDGANFVPGEAGKNQEEIEDIVGGMVAGNTETGITVTYSDNGAGAGKLDFVVDNTVVGFLAGAQTFTGDKIFTGAVDLTGATATASLQAGGTNNTLLATTSFVQQEITSLNLGTASQSAVGDFLASNSGLDDLADVTLNAPVLGHLLVHDGNDFKNRLLASSDLSDTANVALLSANQTFTGTIDFTGGAYTADAPANNAVGREIATASFVRNVIAQVGAVSQLDDLADVTVGGIPLAQDQILIYTANNVFENKTLASTQLSDTADLIRNTSSVGDLSDVNLAGVADGKVLTWDAGALEFRPTAPAQTYTDEDARDAVGTALANGTHSGISFVNNDAGDTIDATVSLSSTDLTDTANIARLNQIQTFSANATFTADVDLTGANATALTQVNADNSTKIATTEFVKNIVAAVGAVADLDDLTDVTLGGIALAEGQVLRYDAGAALFKNNLLSIGDLSDGSNVVKIDAANVLTNDLTLYAGLAPEIAPNFEIRNDTNTVVFSVSGQTGDTSIEGDVTVTGSITVNDLTVNGTTTTVNTTNLEVSDNLISLNRGIGAVANTKDTGLFLDRGTLDPALVLWDEGDDTFKFGTKAGALSTDTDLGGVGFTYVTVSAASPAALSNSNEVATTAWVRGLSIDALSDVDTTTGAPVVGDGLGWDGNNWVPTAFISDVSGLQTEIDATQTGAGLDVNGAYVANGATNYLALATSLKNADELLDAAIKSNANDIAALNLNALTDVIIAGPLDKHFLIHNGNDFVNRLASSGDLSDTANIALLNANQTFTADTRATTQAANDNTTLLATTAFVQQEITGLNLGATYQGINDRLTDISGLAPTNDNYIVGDGNNFVLSTPADVRSRLDLDNLYQAKDDTLNSISSLGTAADKIIYTTGVDAWAESDITAAGRALLDDATAADQRSTLGLDIGTDVQAHDPTLDAISALGTAADKMIYTTGVDTWAESDVSGFGRSLIDDANAADARATLGLGTASTSALTDLLQAANNLSELTNNATARTNLGLTDTATTLLTALLQVANSLSEIAAAGVGAQAAARTNLGLGTAAVSDAGDFLASTASIGALSDVSIVGVANGNTLVWNAVDGEFQPGAGGGGVDTGIEIGDVPVLTAPSITKTDAHADLVIYGRIVESIDYGAVSEAFNAADDFALDYGLITDGVLYASEDYGVLVC